MKKERFLLLFSAVFMLFLSPAFAQEETKKDYLSISIGGFDVVGHDNEAVDFRLEWRLAKKIWNVFHPFIGIEATSDGGLFGLVGAFWDFKFDNNWFITPSLGGGIYKDGDGLDLAHTLQFRTQLEAGYEFDNGHRLSGALSHISNAGLGDRNPGTEVIGVYYSIPFKF